MNTALTRDAAVRVPLICGAMYPCSNPELVGAVSAAGGIGIIQPISLTYVHGHEFRAGVRLAQKHAAGNPVGFNALIEQSSKYYRQLCCNYSLVRYILHCNLQLIQSRGCSPILHKLNRFQFRFRYDIQRSIISRWLLFLCNL